VKSARSHPWYDVAWPVVAGVTVGAGLVAAYRWTGPFAFVIGVLVLELALFPVAWALHDELGYDARHAVPRIAPWGAAGLLSVVGLAEATGGWAFLALGLILLSSPLVRGWSDGGVRGIAAHWAAPGARTRAEFDEIVALSYGADARRTDDGLPPL
jgi:hypothetical protein